MRKLKPSDWVAIAGFALFFNVLSLWCIDISVSAIVNQAIMQTYIALGNAVIPIPMGGLGNGFFKSDPTMTYHVGLYINAGVNFLMFMIIIHKVVKDEKRE
jgi:hypothetical protein